MWVTGMRTRYGKATNPVGGVAPVITDLTAEIVQRWGFLKDFICRRKDTISAQNAAVAAGVSTNESGIYYIIILCIYLNMGTS